MTPVTRYTRVRDRCQELVALLPVPYRTEEFCASLGQLLGSTVGLIPLGLPLACSSLWLGFTGADRIGYNADWPEHEISMAGHAIGHLILGHCGDARDGGQFACTPGGLGDDDRHALYPLLHNPDGGMSRLFSDFEERAATVFSRVLEERLNLRSAEPAGDSFFADLFVCVG